MATNLAIDDDLLTEAKSLGKFKTKRETVNAALVELIARQKRLRLIDAMGTIDFDPNWDYRVMRGKKPLPKKKRKK